LENRSVRPKNLCRAVKLGTNGNALDTNKEQFHMHAGGSCPKGGEISSHAKAYITYTLPKLTVRKRWVMDSLTRQTITLRRNVILSNSILGGMDAVEGVFVWNYTMRGCEKKELEELYRGRCELSSLAKTICWAARLWPMIPAEGRGHGYR
jgi:hypothetical protein